MRRFAGPLAGVALSLGLTGASPAPADARRELRVCADPNNLPFSNERREGFENELAELVARDLDADVRYTWAPQRRGFVRKTLKAHRCDVVMGVPAAMDMLATTRPYYRSGYVFVYAPATPHVRSLDAPELRTMRIGVPLVGDDGANPPPVLALAPRNLVANVRGYPVYGDYREESPPLRALRRADIDVALAPIPESEAPRGSTFRFDIAMGVRRADRALRAELDAVIARRGREIAALLDRYGVPRM
jgi:quinoprotein dehydrogenase-associated probable ABC transporter substrate-binding protein